MDIERIIDLALKAVRESVFDFEWSAAEAKVFRYKFGDKLNTMLEDTAQEGESDDLGARIVRSIKKAGYSVGETDNQITKRKIEETMKENGIDKFTPIWVLIKALNKDGE